MRKIIACCLGMLLCGCSHNELKYVGKLGDEKVYILHAGFIDGPNLTTFATVKPNGEATIQPPVSGPGVSTSLYPSAAQVISSGIIKPSDFRVNVTQPK